MVKFSKSQEILSKPWDRMEKLEAILREFSIIFRRKSGTFFGNVRKPIKVF